MSDSARPGQGWIRWFFLAFLVVQVIVPVIQLSKPRPARFGWQMFSGYPPMAVYSVQVGDSVRDVRVTDYVVVPRGDVVYRDALPGHLCQRIAGATAIFELPIGDTVPRRLPCPR